MGQNSTFRQRRLLQIQAQFARQQQWTVGSFLTKHSEEINTACMSCHVVY